ncbi:MAG: hypothetical protein MHPSP_000799, partial [Paramarteilia canceri]
MVFIDEVGFSVVTRPKRAWAKSDQRPYVSVAGARSRNISVFAAMTKQGLLLYK